MPGVLILGLLVAVVALIPGFRSNALTRACLTNHESSQRTMEAMTTIAR